MKYDYMRGAAYVPTGAAAIQLAAALDRAREAQRERDAMSAADYAQWCEGNRAYLATDPPEYEPAEDDDIPAEPDIAGDTLKEWQMPF